MSRAYALIATVATLYCVASALGQDSVFQSLVASADKAVETGDFSAAERFLQSAAREATGNESKSAIVWTKQAFVADGMSRYADAEQFFRKALAQADRSKDRSLIAHRETVFGKHYVLCQDYEQAEPHFKRALAIRERVNGPNAWETAQLVRDIGTMHRDAGRLDVAESLYRRALQGLENAKGKEYHLALTQLFVRQANHDAVEALVRSALDALVRQKFETPFDQADCYATLGEALRKQEKLAEAEQAFSKALKLLEQVKLTNVEALPILTRAAAFYRENGRTAEAAPLEERAKAIDEQHRKAKAETSRDRQS